MENRGLRSLAAPLFSCIGEKTMLSYTGKRLLQTVFVLFGISLITFLLLQVVPGDPVALMLEKRADPETIAKVRSELGLDLPYYVQYLNFIKGAVHLDFGTSYFTKEVVTDALFRCFKVTVKLACMYFVFASVIGIPCGIFAAVKRGKGIDSVVMLLSIIGVSAPAFWVAIILQIIFGLKHLTFCQALRWVHVMQEILPVLPEPVCWKSLDRITSVQQKQKELHVGQLL